MAGPGGRMTKWPLALTLIREWHWSLSMSTICLKVDNKKWSTHLGRKTLARVCRRLRRARLSSACCAKERWSNLWRMALGSCMAAVGELAIGIGGRPGGEGDVGLEFGGDGDRKSGWVYGKLANSSSMGEVMLSSLILLIILTILCGWYPINTGRIGKSRNINRSGTTQRNHKLHARSSVQNDQVTIAQMKLAFPMKCGQM